jgi:ribosome-associated protein
MTETELLVESIKEGIQEKKGKQITIVDMRDIESICSFFVICEGTSNTQIMAITDSIVEYVKKKTGEKPYATDGLNNATWIAMDYGDVIVHIFEPVSRIYYDLEHLWSDAKLTDVPDLV